MTTQWLNKTCPLYQCEDRKEQARLRELLEQTEKDKNGLYSEIQQLKGMISNGALSIQGAIEEVLKAKDIKGIEESKIREILNKAFDEKQISSIINQNLMQKKEMHDLRMQLSAINMQINSYKEEIMQLESTIRDRERRDIENIKELNNMDVKANEQVKQLREDKEKLEKLKNELKAFDEFKQERLKEISNLRNEHEVLIKSIKGDKDAVLKYRAELIHYKRYKPRAVKKFEKICLKIDDCISRGRKDKALALYGKVLKAYGSLGNYEQVMVSDVYAKAQEAIK